MTFPFGACRECCCPNRSWRAFGEAHSLITTGDSPAGMAFEIENYDFSGLDPHTQVRRDHGAWGSYGTCYTLKIQNHAFSTYKKVGSPGTVIANGTFYKFSAGWFQPSSHHYWKTVITRVGEYRATASTHSYGIFSDPVQTRVACTPNEIIQFGLPPLGETWIIADCQDDYQYTKIDRDQEMCLRVCIGDSDPWWSRMCHTFQLTSGEVAAYIAEYGPCALPPKKRIVTCMDGRGSHNSVWQC